MIELRWKIIAGGQKTLQYRQQCDKTVRAQCNIAPFVPNIDFLYTKQDIVWSDWQDVPDFYDSSDVA